MIVRVALCWCCSQKLQTSVTVFSYILHHCIVCFHWLSNLCTCESAAPANNLSPQSDTERGHSFKHIQFIIYSGITQMVECSTSNFIPTECRRYFFCVLFTELFCKDFWHLFITSFLCSAFLWCCTQELKDDINIAQSELCHNYTKKSHLTSLSSKHPI